MDGDDINNLPEIDPNEILPEPNLDDDAENPFFLAPDHPLFAPLQEKLKSSLGEELRKSKETLLELQMLKKQLNKR